jgi:hypothetical protein
MNFETRFGSLKLIQHSNLGSVLEVLVIHASTSSMKLIQHSKFRNSTVNIKRRSQNLEIEEQLNHLQAYFQCCPKQSSRMTRTRVLLLAFD